MCSPTSPIAICGVIFFIVTAVRFAESKATFTRKPKDPTYVVEGQDIILQWEYAVDDWKKDLHAVIWGVTDDSKNVIPLMYEDEPGKVQISSRIHPAYKGRTYVTGIATLVVQNSKLNDSRSFSCYLSPATGSGQPRRESSVQVSITVPPKITEVPPIVRYVNYNDSAIITCNASGIPTPNVTWYRAGKPINDSHYSVNVVTAGLLQLTIKRVSKVDLGYYDCHAFSDGMKPTNMSYYLGITQAAHKDSSLPATQKAKSGDSVVLFCPGISFPPPEVEWVFQGVTVQKSYRTHLVIPHVTESSYGSYSCLVRSLDGTRQIFDVSLESSEVPVDYADVKVDTKSSGIFGWKNVPGAQVYLLRLYESNFTDATALIGDGTSNSTEITYQDLPFKHKNPDKRPPKVTLTIEVVAIDKSGGIVGRMVHPAVDIYDTATTSTVSLLILILSLAVHNLQ